MRAAPYLIAALLAVLLGACATQTYRRETAPLRGAVEAPLRDLSLMREAPPALLLEAARTPYQLPAEPICASISAEIAALDLFLGPDVDAKEDDDERLIDVSELLIGAVGGIWSLPYRAIVRRVSGADQRDRDLRRAILAGMVRRGFLKGAAQDCPTPQTVPPA